MSERRLHACTLCEAGCGLEVTVVDGIVSRIRGDRDDVASHGYLCPKGPALKELQHDPDRLRRPLIRRNGALVEVSFDEAFAEIDRLMRPMFDEDRTGVGLVIGNPTVHRTGLVLYALDLAAALGSPNVFSAASLDQMPKQLAVGLMFGDFYSVPVPDIDRTDLLVVIGANPVVSNGSLWTVPDVKGRLAALRERGGRLVTVDPRRTETAAIADTHLSIRPGADAAFLAALLHVIVTEGRVRPGRIAEYVSGLDQLARLVEPFAPERVAAHCGIDADAIVALARELSDTPRAAVYGRLGTCLQRHGSVVGWLVDVVNVATGHLDEPGGAMFATPPAFAGNTTGTPGFGAGVTIGAWSSRVSGLPEVTGQLPMTCLAEEIETEGPGRIRALVTIGSNAVLSSPDGPRLARALDSLDVLICLDVYVNETTSHADVILPGPSPLEESHYDVFFSQYAVRNTARFSQPVVAKDPAVPDDWETMVRLIAIARGLGPSIDVDSLDDELTRGLLGDLPTEMVDGVMAVLGERRGADRRVDLGLRSGPFGDGFGANPDGLSLDRVIEHPSGIDLGPLVPRVPEMLRTPSGAIELCPPLLVDALALVVDDLDRPAPELVLVGRRHLRSNNSWMHNITTLAKGADRCTLLVHPDDAAARRLVDGELARITAAATGRSIEAPIRIDPDMRPGVVSLPHGWGHDHPQSRTEVAARRPGVNVNELADLADRETVTGTAVLNGLVVRVEPIGP